MRKEIQEWIEKGNRTEGVVALGRIVVCRRENDGSLE